MALALSPAARKRELTRHYRDYPPPMGVYAIRCAASGRTWLDASMNVPAALNRHRFQLGLKSHPNRELLQDWLAHGPDTFRFEVVDVVKRRDDPAAEYQAELADLLALWREELQP